MKAGESKEIERTEERELPQGGGESLVAQLDSAVNQTEQLRDQQVQQQYSDQLGIYVQERAEQIDRLQSNLAAALTSEQAQLQAIQRIAPRWPAHFLEFSPHIPSTHVIAEAGNFPQTAISFPRWFRFRGHRAHNCHYEPCPFYARKRMLQRFNFVLFSGSS